MKKLKLNLEDLKIESFSINAIQKQKTGTVNGYADSNLCGTSACTEEDVCETDYCWYTEDCPDSNWNSECCGTNDFWFTCVVFCT